MRRMFFAALLGMFSFGLIGAENADAQGVLYQDVPVDVDCGGVDCGAMSLANANTTRKLAVTSNGTIYAAFYGSTGIWVAKSTDRGASFNPAVLVDSDNSEPEIAASASGVLYVIWNKSSVSSFVVSKSTDAGQTWSTPVATGMSGWGGPAHMAVDGDYVYAVDQQGSTLAYSHDAGVTWSTTPTGSSYVFADVRVDRLTGDVYVLVDNPSVFWYKSVDHGVTLSSANATGKSVYFSVGGMSSDGNNLYFYMAGSQSNLERIDLLNGTALTQTVTATRDSQGRSLAADNCGNVVSGHNSGTDLYFQYSSDFGATFSAEQMVVSSGDRANASINETNGDIMFLYEKAGDIFLSTYSGLLTGGSNCYAVEMSLTAVEFTAPGQNPAITLTNSTSNPITVDNISVTGTSFTVSHNCGASIAPGSSCQVVLSGSQQGNEILDITLSGVSRTIPVTMGQIAAAQPPETTTTLAPSTTTTTLITATTVVQPSTTEIITTTTTVAPQVATTVVPDAIEAPNTTQQTVAETIPLNDNNKNVSTTIDIVEEDLILPATGNNEGFVVVALFMVLLGIVISTRRS